MNGAIIRSESYIQEQVAHIVVRLEETDTDGQPVYQFVAVNIPVSTFAGKTAAQRRAIVVVAVRAALTPPSRSEMTLVDGTLEV